MDYLYLAPSLRVQRSLLQRHWDKKLSPCSTNPFPLAPRDLVRLGLINPENYASENHMFGLFCDSIMRQEVFTLHREQHVVEVICPEIKILGVGLSRGLGWIEQAVDLGFYLSAYDVSDVACELFSRLIQNFPNNHLIQVVTGEVESELGRTETDRCETFAYYLSQFIQVQKRTKMRHILHRLGSLISHTSGVTRSVYLVHPFGMDNLGPLKWGGQLHSVEWGDTIPYSQDEILVAMGGNCSLRVLGVHRYFHHTYSLVRIQTKG